MSGCMNACGHHHVGHIGILGVDKHGEEWYQITLGGSASGTSSLGEVIGPSVAKDRSGRDHRHASSMSMWQQREDGEEFLETVRRIGVDAVQREGVCRSSLRAARWPDEWASPAPTRCQRAPAAAAGRIPQGHRRPASRRADAGVLLKPEDHDLAPLLPYLATAAADRASISAALAKAAATRRPPAARAPWLPG